MRQPTPARSRATLRARLPRPLHPMAWWLWALGLATAVSRTTNPLLLLLVLAVLGFVVTSRRSDAPWARAITSYFVLATVVVVIRVGFRVVFGDGLAPGDHLLFRLPQLPLPHWAAGVRIGGPVSLEAVTAAAVDGLRLGCLLCCVGAANALANPRRALRMLPGALYELGVAVVVCVTVAPQLIDSVQRVRRARRLRAGTTHGVRALGAIAVPVLEDALDRSLRLAASMDSRGYGRTGTASPGSRRVTGALLLVGMAGLCTGAYGLLAASAPRLLGLPMLATGAAGCLAGLVLGGRRVRHTRYRPDPWRWPEWAVSALGVTAAGLLVTGAATTAAALNPGYSPLLWPTLPVLPAAGILAAGLAGLIAPPPVRAATTGTPLPASRGGAAGVVATGAAA